MKYITHIALFLLITGCGRNPLLSDIQRIAAEQLNKAPAEMTLTSTFSALGADDLDVVEITMTVEDKMGITIQDSDLAKAAGTSPDQNLAEHLTLHEFAGVAASSPKGQRRRHNAPQESDDGTLREAQVGPYAELSKRPNPKGYVLVFVPSFEVLAQSMEQKLGRTMADSERDALKAKAAVIALPPAMADDMKRKQAERMNQQ
ncbi:MAG: acyl carrier protein [Lentisphaerae bacterium]|nr:acyl carrier protein [Lentisphaerota bacterium]